ncbi:MAG: redoxin domain-containing protein, partial [Mesorhizobium sp.]
MSGLAARILLLALVAGPAQAHDAQHDERLPAIGPAPDFTLTSQDRERVSLHDFRGKAIAIAFIYTHCTD